LQHVCNTGWNFARKGTEWKRTLVTVEDQDFDYQLNGQINSKTFF